MLPVISLSSYLELVDWTARLCRTGKARLTTEVAGIMARLGTSPEYWQVHLVVQSWTVGRLRIRRRSGYTFPQG